MDPDTGRTTARPLRQTNEYIHPSVRTRFRLNGPGISDKGVYECRALTDNYKLTIDYGTQNTKSGDPDIFWKIKFKDDTAVRILPEAPLWRLERELCRRDPRTWEFVRRPPATGGAKKRGKQRPMSADFSASRAGGGGRESGFMNGGAAAAGGRSGRKSFVDDRRSKSRVRSLDRDRQKYRSRSRSRARVVDDYSDSLSDERESDLRESMPHRRRKDKAWWDGQSQAGGRSPRRSSMRV